MFQLSVLVFGALLCGVLSPSAIVWLKSYVTDDPLLFLLPVYLTLVLTAKMKVPPLNRFVRYDILSYQLALIYIF